MLYFALDQKEQESLAEPEPLPQQGVSKGDMEPHRPRAVPQEPHLPAAWPRPNPQQGSPHLTLDTGHDNYFHRLKLINLDSDNQQKRNHSEHKRCYKRQLNLRYSSHLGQILPGKGMLQLPQVFCSFKMYPLPSAHIST